MKLLAAAAQTATLIFLRLKFDAIFVAPLRSGGKLPAGFRWLKDRRINSDVPWSNGAVQVSAQPSVTNALVRRMRPTQAASAAATASS
ncbi:hypothetical protein [Piscinibacter sakaiensis]|uniref:hypothetical protein n=1 Tax=Piscinibacter sakaiensis TaxID=1547922 RepID=UPI003AAAF58E